MKSKGTVAQKPDGPAETSRLEAFTAWVKRNITGDEKGEAQIFLDRLFQAFGHRGCLDVGGKAEFRVKKGKEAGSGVSFADYVWKPVVLIEMKRRGEDLRRHYKQAFDYWMRLVPNRPRYVLLCNFDEVWIYDLNRQLDQPLDQVLISDLAKRRGALSFLASTPETPIFGNDRESVTREAATLLAGCYRSLISRGIPDDLSRRFVLQTLVCLFAEDIGLLDAYTLSRVLEDCKTPQDSFDLFGNLFEAMNRAEPHTGGRFKTVPYFNGGLFSTPAPVELTGSEVSKLQEAAKADWSKVSPEIFGSLFESSMTAVERHARGAHFTAPADIMKIVRPCIVDPIAERIEKAESLRRLDRIHMRMWGLRILDPACGSGNFLYIAYRELKKLEHRLLERKRELGSATRRGQGTLNFVSPAQFFGIDINPFAVELAKVTLMVARKLLIDELNLSEKALPFDNLDNNIIARDALIDASGAPTRWPKADIIIGNPPFLGAKRIRPELGDAYADKLKAAYPDIPGMADFCVYWFRKSSDALEECTVTDPFAGRAGLVGTQNIRNGASRKAGLDYIVTDGTILEAVQNQPWSGDANVHVSIVNWVKGHAESVVSKKRTLWTPISAKLTKHAQFEDKVTLPELLEQRVDNINSQLTSGAGVASRVPLECNKHPKACFQGKIPGYDGFLLERREMEALAHDSAEVLVPYLTGRELLDKFEITRWAIDFGNRDLMGAKGFPSAFKHVEDLVLPQVRATYERELQANSAMVSARKEHLERWWQFWNRRDALAARLSTMNRYVACSRVSRRPIMTFVSSKICPSDLVQVFAFEDDYSFGILQSSAHFEWLKTSSRMKVEADVRYTVRDVFETFPWPQGPEHVGVDARLMLQIAEASRRLRNCRSLLLESLGHGLRDIYRTLELPGKCELKDLHSELDALVMKAYGISRQDQLIPGLLDLNSAIATREKEGLSVVSPGVRGEEFRTPQFVSTDCFEAESRKDSA